MKIRSGFVSNSSSSSFVCIGINLDDNEELKTKFVNEEDYDYQLTKEGKKLLPKHTEYQYFEEVGGILGWFLGDGETFECENVEFDKLKEYAEKLEKATGLKPKLMGGTYYC